MAKCNDCQREMHTAKSCVFPNILIDGKWYERVTSDSDLKIRCHDCGIYNKPGNIHHLGCDMERCPVCHGQLISCGHEPKAIGIAFQDGNK